MTLGETPPQTCALPPYRLNGTLNPLAYPRLLPEGGAVSLNEPGSAKEGPGWVNPPPVVGTIQIPIFRGYYCRGD